MAISVNANLAVKAVKGRLLLLSVLLSICFVFQSEVMAATESVNEPNIFIIAEPNVVKGFPVIVKVKFQGFRVVPKLSLFGEKAEIQVVLASKTGESEYIIESTAGRNITLSGHGGRSTRDGTCLYMAVLEEDEERTMLFDLSSLRPDTNIRNGIMLDDVPPGKYDVSLKLPVPWADVNSNSVELEILPPSHDENLFLQEMEKTRKLGKLFRPGTGPNWCQLLRQRLQIPKTELNKLSEIARRQLQFHILLSDVLSSKLSVKDIDIEPLRTMPVPNYLEPEKDFLFLEMEMISEKDVRTKTDLLLQKEPGLKWRLEQVKADGHNFLLYKNLRFRHRKDPENKR